MILEHDAHTATTRNVFICASSVFTHHQEISINIILITYYAYASKCVT